MTTLTLDQVQKIVYSATSSAKALFALHQAGASVYNSSFCPEWYSVDVEGHCIAFSDNPNDALFYVFFDKKMVTPELRKSFLESQQQNTSVVPANEQTQPSVALVACAAEARPNPYRVTTLIQLIDVMRPIFNLHDSNGNYQREVFHQLQALVVTDSMHLGIQTDILDLSIHEFLSVLKFVNNSNPELTVFCPSCDYHSATAQKAPEADFYHINCSQCGLDGDREQIFLSPSERQNLSQAQ